VRYVWPQANLERGLLCMQGNRKETQLSLMVHFGPFIGDTKQDIARLFAEYEAGRFPRLSELDSSRTQMVRSK
jgi:hypothetical protein